MEEFKEIVGYEGLYQVSDLGRIYSILSKKFIKPTIRPSGYYQITLIKNGKMKSFRVNRLVYYSFHPERDSEEDKRNGLVINHINEDKTDNRLCNLNLMTIKENTNYGTGLIRRSLKVNIPILQYDENDNFIKEWPSQTIASKILQINQGGISQCLNGRIKYYKKSIWKYK